MIGPGTEIGGFVIESVAGRGGMGVVYRARQRRPERIVALKVISSEFAGDPQFRTRFEREAAIASQIEHPNVIPVHAVGEDAGTLYIAMRFVDGLDLRTLLAGQRRLEPRRAAAIVDQAAQALDAAHAAGLVHRDVKPANILLTSGGREHVYLSDFGVARHLTGGETLTGTGAFIGTIDYVAPEQARGEPVDSRADVYSLGCVLFQALTGTVPFPSENDLAKLYAHDTQPPPSVLERAPELPAAFEPVLARAMSKRPDERYLSAGDLGRAAVAASVGEALSRAEHSVAVGAAAPVDVATVPASRPRPPSAPDPRRPTRRRLSWALAGLAAAIVAAVIVIVATGGSGGSSVPVLTLDPVPTQALGPIHDEHQLAVRQTSAPGGYQYRLTFSTINAPASAPASTVLPLYLTLQARRGSSKLITVQRLKLPAAWRWRKDSRIASFTLDPDPDGSGQVGLSWYVKTGDTGDVTHYLNVAPQGISID
jgi:predicted Ser/Thr protein kinase